MWAEMRMRLGVVAKAAIMAVFAVISPAMSGTALTKPFVISGGLTYSIMSDPEAALVAGDVSLGSYNRVQVCTRRFDGQIELSVTPLDRRVGNGTTVDR